MSHRMSRAPNDLRAFWMPFTANRQFKKAPRMFVAAEGMHYTTADGRRVLDGTAGLWCCNAGHCRPRITQAIQAQAAEMDYAPAFQMGHPKAFELANRLVAMAPEEMEHVFFCNSGSEAVETALKIAIAYQRAIGRGLADAADRARARLSRGELRRDIGRRDREQPQVLRHAAFRRGPSAAHARPRAQPLVEGAAGARGGARGRARADRGAARRLDHRRGDRRAGRGIDRRADPAQGLSRAAARDLHPARDPPDLRRGDYRVRPHRAPPSRRRSTGSCRT